MIEIMANTPITPESPQPPPQPQYAPPMQTPSQPVGPAKGLALSALIVGIVAFLLGLVPVAGALLGLAAVTLGIMAIGRKQKKALAVTGLVLGALGLISSLGVAAGLGATSNSSTASSQEIEEAAPSEEPEPEPQPEPEPKPEPAPVETPAPAVTTPDLATFYETDERSLALVAKDPDAFIGTNMILYGNITQYDNFTGKCGMRLSVGHTVMEHSFDYDHNTIALSGDGESNCPVLAPLVQGDNVKIWATVLGAYDYDTAIGGTATAILTSVWYAEVLPATEY